MQSQRHPINAEVGPIRTGVLRAVRRTTAAGRRAAVGVMAAIVTLAAALALTAGPASAGIASSVWTGGGADANWKTPANWQGGVAPTPGNILWFPAGAARTTNTNNFAAGTSFWGIHFTGSGATYTLGGNQVALGSGGISMDGSTSPDVVTLALPIRLAADQTFALGSFILGGGQITYSGAIDLAGRTLTFSAPPGTLGTQRLTGSLSGAGNIVVAGGSPEDQCKVIFAGTNTSTGTTTVNQGCEAVVNGDYSTRATIVGVSGGLEGKGTLGALTSASYGGTVSAASDTSPTSILTVKGPLKLGAGGNLYVDIEGPTAGTGYSQVVAKGTVSLGSFLAVTGNFHPVFGQTFTILSNQGGAAISGTFKDLPEGAITPSSSGAAYRITYKGGALGRDVVLTAVSTGNTATWTGGGANASWTTVANWAGSVAPKAGDDLYFPPGSARTTNLNNYPTDFAFHSMYFPSGGYSISGSRIKLYDGGVLVGGTESVVSLSLPIVLGADSFFRVESTDHLRVSGAINLAGHNLYLGGSGELILSGVLTGAGKISDFDSDRVFLTGSSPDAGTIELGAGSLSVGGDYHLRSVIMGGTNSPTLTGTGALGPVTATDGLITPSGTLTVTGKLSLAPDVIYQAVLGGTATGRYAQLAVKGPVALGGAVLRPYATFSPPVGTVFTIVSNQGGVAVSGTFAGLPEGAAVVDTNNTSITYRISYKGGTSGRDVTLMVLNPTLLPEADLNVTQAASPDPVAVGGKARFEITVTNYGPESTKVSLRDRVPQGTTLVSLSQLAGWSCRTGTGAAGQGINCTSDGELAAGTSQTFTLVVRVGAGAGTSVTNKATVSGSQADSNTADNTSLSTIAVG